MSAVGTSRQLVRCSDMSEVGGRAEVTGGGSNRRDWPWADIASPQIL